MSEVEQPKVSALSLSLLAVVSFLGIGFGIVASRTTACFVIDNPFVCRTDGTSLFEILLAGLGSIAFIFWYSGRFGSASIENKRRVARLFTALAATPFTLWLILYLAFGNY